MNLDILNKMHETINAIGIVVNEVASHNCYGRAEMNKSLSGLRVMMRELNKPPAEITAEDVKRLREHTGEGLMACKKALSESNGDFNKAVERLRTLGNI